MDRKVYNYNKRYRKNTKVFVQIKPTVSSNWDTVKLLEDRKSLYIRYPQDFNKGNLKNIPNFWHFRTDGVLFNYHPLEVYQIITEGLIERAVEGHNVVILAYGQTGTGKSMTLNGLQCVYENRGISLRLMSELFDVKTKYRDAHNITLKISCLEIREGCVIDLLKQTEITNEKRIYAPYKDITKMEISGKNVGFKCIFDGIRPFLAEKQRFFSLNSPYNSHIYPLVMTIYVESCSSKFSNPVKKFSKIHIVDMSGADTDGNMTCAHKKIRDIGAANVVKTFMEQIMLFYQKPVDKPKESLRGHGSLVEYLSDSLRPECFIRFIAHINTDQENLHVTLSQLRFGHIAKCIAPAKLKPIIKTHEQLENERRKNEIDYLMKQNYLNSMIMNTDLTSTVSESRAQQMKGIVDDFISGKVSDLALFNVTDAQKVLKTIKMTYDTQILELKGSIVEKDDELEMLKKELMLTIKGSLASKISEERTTDSTEKISRRRMSSDIRSTLRSSVLKPRKSSRVGSVENYGKSLGKSSSSIQKSLTRSKAKVRSSKKSASTRSSSKLKSLSSSISQQVSKTSSTDQDFEQYLLANLKNYEDVWNAFVVDDNFNNLYRNLKRAYDEYKTILEQYNICSKRLDAATQKLQTKREHQAKLHFFRENRDLDCCLDEEMRMQEIAYKVGETLQNLIRAISEDKERLLSLQAEMNICASYFTSIKKEISDTFMKFCLDNFSSSFGTGIQSMEEKFLNEEEAAVVKRRFEKEAEENEILTFNELQMEMLKDIEVKKNQRRKLYTKKM